VSIVFSLAKIDFKYRYLAPDRLGKIIKFNADAYAILEASPAQSE
jgi:hypothetical protein